MAWMTVYGARFVVGGIEDAEVGPCEGFHVMMSHPPARPAFVPVSNIWGIIVVCSVLWFFPCMCSCGSIVVYLKRWAWVLRFLQVSINQNSVSPSLCSCVSLGGAV